MGRPYSHDLRGRTVDAAGSNSRQEAAKRFGVGAATAARWMTVLATTETVGSVRKEGHATSSSIRTRRS